jgi:uncharacterized protein YecE (DUF72 family)
MIVRIGTSGYAYPEWVGGFYPRSTTQHDMLPYYASRFACVEINSSFYRAPTREQVAKMSRRSPAAFGFVLKVPKTASHERSTADLAQFKDAADVLAANGKLLGLILQEPEAFHNTAANREWVVRVCDALRPHRVAVEFRHRSWNAPNLSDWMAHIRADLVSVGVPNVPDLFPNGLRVANRRVYARLHSQNADNWYGGGKLRYDYDYKPEELGAWANGLKELAATDRADEALIFFNNCVGAQAAENAEKMVAQLLGAPNVRVAEPPPTGLF